MNTIRSLQSLNTRFKMYFSKPKQTGNKLYVIIIVPLKKTEKGKYPT